MMKNLADWAIVCLFVACLFVGCKPEPRPALVIERIPADVQATIDALELRVSQLNDTLDAVKLAAEVQIEEAHSKADAAEAKLAACCQQPAAVPPANPAASAPAACSTVDYPAPQFRRGLFRRFR